MVTHRAANGDTTYINTVEMAQFFLAELAKHQASQGDRELEDRTDAVRTCIKAQLHAARQGDAHRTPKELIGIEKVIKNNAAKHNFDLSKPFNEKTLKDLRKEQRGTRPSPPECEFDQHPHCEIDPCVPCAPSASVTSTRSIGVITSGTIGGISAAKRLEGIASALRQQSLWEPCDHWEPGTFIEVKSSVLTDDKLRVELPRRLQGMVVDVDEEGDARVAFPGLVQHGLAPVHCERWVLKDSRRKFLRAALVDQCGAPNG